jgi:hypothetical protein
MTIPLVGIKPQPNATKETCTYIAIKTRTQLLNIQSWHPNHMNNFDIQNFKIYE